MNLHEKYMRIALELAEKGRSTASPNPMVGCIIMKGGKIIGRGYHKKAGKPHAEAIALRQAGKNARGAAMYVTLEPCSHFGRTPPCSRAIIAAGIKEVIIAHKDPNPKIHGIGDLKHAGIKTNVGICEKEAKKMNEVFAKYITTRMPFVILKLATTLDGNIAASAGSSSYITSKESRTLVHKMRTEVDAVMVGKNTVLRDNPRLTPRYAKGKDPWKVVVDSRAEIPLRCNLMKCPHKLILAVTGKADWKKVQVLAKKGVAIIVCPQKKGKVHLNYLMKELGKKNIASVMIEAGQSLATAALKEGIVDKILVFIAPKISGEGMRAIGDLGIRHMKKALQLKDVRIKKIGDDVLVEGYL